MVHCWLRPLCHPAGRFDGREVAHFQSPWMRGMYVGQLDSEKVGKGPSKMGGSWGVEEDEYDLICLPGSP